MITIAGRFATYGECWFDEEPPASAAVDVLTFRLRPAPVAGYACSAFHSLYNDLGESDALLASFGSTNRYKIKRAESKDRLASEIAPATDAALDAFCAFFDEFAAQKKLERAYRRGLKAMRDAGALVLSSARHEGGTLVCHAHVIGRDTAALLHSASHFRAQDGAERALVGRANRWLHWRDMLAFREMGLTRYDWGGMFDDESVPAHASVNSFKREFGGVPHCAYNCVAPLTLRGRLYVAARGVVERMTPDADG